MAYCYSLFKWPLYKLQMIMCVLRLIFYTTLLFFVAQGCSSKKTATAEKATVPKTGLEEYLKSDISKWNVPDSFKALLPALDSIFLDDQRYRSAHDNDLYFDNIKNQHALDSINVIKIKRILSKYGWLDVNQIGARTVNLLFVLQHCKDADKEYFLPILLDAYRGDRLVSSGLFLFIDRLLMGKREQQLFGTQMIARKGRPMGGMEDMYPLFEPDKVEERWKRYGNGFFKYKSYIKAAYNKVDWDATVYQQFKQKSAQQLNISLDSTRQIHRILYLLDSCKALMGKEKGK